MPTSPLPYGRHRHTDFIFIVVDWRRVVVFGLIAAALLGALWSITRRARFR